ncbi:hypothetical protein [Planctomyces sp. SH-PL62]|uniref:hypothetical protein n=1 Tax=Planctomyces sp. SH-PL62 TaxID=1636152 RepID=UPI00078C2F5E|nr:hypothetical protein [Planctomyces sp. SH-PL62]AMV38633.1 hypothetical protein VT85_14440 [Planctomyces sp. SH-PL62]
MTRAGRCGLLVLGFLVVAGSEAWADPPKVNDASPFGARRGEPAEVTLTGTGLAANPRLIASFPFQVEALPPERSKPEGWAFRLTVPAGVPIGVYPIRVQTDEGVSNPLLFAVGQLAQVAEVEANDGFETAQALAATPVVVEGRTAGNDVDQFRFAGKKGQKIVVDAQCARIGSVLDPSIRLTQATPSRRFIAAADDTPGLLTDARLIVELPEDGDYVVEISDSRYAGGGRPVYRLLVGEIPIAEEVYPLGGRDGETVGFELRGGTSPEPRAAVARLEPMPLAEVAWPRFAGGASGIDVESIRPLVVSRVPEIREPTDPAAPPIRVAAPAVLNGRIDPPGDEDRFVVATKPGAKLRVRVEAASLGSSLDAVLQVLNPKGAAIAQGDDQSIAGAMRAGAAVNTINPDPALAVDVPADADEVTLVLRDMEKRGGVGFPYRIVVEPASPNFGLALDASEANVPRGGTRVVGVTLTREGYDGPVSLTVQDPPAGLTFRPGSVAAGQAIGKLSLSAAADATFAMADLKIVGEGQGPDGPIRRVASRRDVFAQQEYLATNALERETLATAPAQPSVVTLDAPAGPIEAIHGQPVTIPVTIARTPGADAAMDLSALPPAPGFTAAVVKVAEKAADAPFVVAVAAEAALGTTTLGLSAKGKFGEVERTIEAPAVTLQVVRPIDLTLETPAVEAAPGATVEIKGKVVRKGAFKEPVVVKLDGLPAGLKAEPVTVAPEATDFVVKAVADADAKPAEAAATVAAAFQIDKKDYAFPPAPLAAKIVAAPPK